MKAEIKGNNLVITLPLEEPHLSSTGYSMVVASTHGKVLTNAQVNGHNIKITANAWIPLGSK